MKFRLEYAFLILSAILLVADGQAGKSKSNDYSYSYDVDYDYKNPVVKPVDKRIACYSCSYEEEDGVAHTTTNCNEPFESFQVPEVMCNGSCMMSHIWVEKPRHFTIVRGCRPICKERVLENMYTKCCTTKLCNGFTSSIQEVKFSVCLTLLLAFIALVDIEIVS